MVDLLSEINGSNCSETVSLRQSPPKLITRNSTIVLTGILNKLECGNLNHDNDFDRCLVECLDFVPLKLRGNLQRSFSLRTSTFLIH